MFYSKDDFEKFVLEYKDKAVLFANRYVKDIHFAEDIVQESFASVYVYGNRNKKESLKTYLYTIIRNKCIDTLRKKRYNLNNDFILVEKNTPEKRVLEKERIGIIRRKINDMNDDYKTVLYLLENEQISYSEMSEFFGKNPGQIKVLIFRARKKLRLMLEREGIM